MPFKLITYYHGKDIPELPGKNTFHPRELFQIHEAAPGYTPLLIVATEDGKPVARLFAVIHEAKRWLPSSLVKYCVVYSEGEFLDESPSANKEKAEEILGDMLKHFTQEASCSCVLIESRNLDNSIPGYRVLRVNDCFPVDWLQAHNSLHSMKKTEDRFSPLHIRQVRKGFKSGAKVEEVHTMGEIHDFSRMLRKIYSSRVRRYFSANDFLRRMNGMLIKGQQAEILTVRYREKITDSSVCICSGDDAYLWLSGEVKKVHALQRPGVLAARKTLENVHQRGFHRMKFMDVGLPFRKHGYRDFVFRFGGEQSGICRWFRVNWSWLNELLVRFYV